MSLRSLGILTPIEGNAKIYVMRTTWN